MSNKPSKFRDILAFLNSVRGDFSTITSPPQLLAPYSAVEVARSFTSRPALFIAPALEPDPRKRALLVLKWILCSLKAEFYPTHDVEIGVKKPLNSFLGEVYIASFTDEAGKAEVIAEQVSHHPPITAVHMFNSEHGITGTGYAHQSMTFTPFPPSINISHAGHATIHYSGHTETHLFPMFNLSITGFLSGKLYPEISGTYHIISSSGFISEITFSGKGFWKGKKNTFEAKLYRAEDKKRSTLYSVKGQWSGRFTIYDATATPKRELETWDSATPPTSRVTFPERENEWETRVVWKDTLEAIRKGDYGGIMNTKSKVENWQRVLRRKEKEKGEEWKPRYFSSVGESKIFDELVGVEKSNGWRLEVKRTKGVWVFNG